MIVQWHCANCNKTGSENINLETVFKERNRGETLLDILSNLMEKIHEEQEKFRSNYTTETCKEPLVGIKNKWQ